MPNLTREIRALLALPLVLTVACFPGGVTDATKNAGSVAANSSPAQNAPVASVASPAPSVIVKNNGGHPVQGVPVTFAVVSGGGSVTGATVETDANGIARVGSWTYGTVVGSNKLNATIGNLAPVSFVVSTKPAAASQLSKVNDGQSAEIGKALPQPVAVVVKDAYGNVVSGVTVSFTTASGSVSPASAQTDANGRAQTTWTMGTTPGAAALNAAIANLPAVAFAATATPAQPSSLTKGAGDAQSGTVGTALANPVTVTVKDTYGNAVSGATVQFAASGNGSANPASAMTDASGQASTQWTLPKTAGSATLSATLGSLPAVSFSATARPGAADTLSIAAAYPSRDTVNTAVGDSVSVRLVDGYGNAISNAAIAFSGGGTVSPSSAATNAAGVARAKWVLPKTAGAASLVASIGNLSVTFNVTAVPGPAANIARVGSSQTGTVGQVLPDPLQVTVTDAYGNAISDATVNFSSSGDGVATPASATTNASGQASTQWKLPTTSGNALLGASVQNISTTFGATANPDVPALIMKGMQAGDNQTGSGGSTLPQPLVVAVRDQYNNAINNADVNFTTDGGSVSPSATKTNAAGDASTSWTLPNVAGTYSVTVTSGNAPAVVFHATATVVNNDPCAVKGALTIGGSVTGDLSTSQCALSVQKKIDLWSLDVNGSTPLEIRLVADDARLDPELMMYRGQFSGLTDVIAENDDNFYYDGSTNSGIRILGGTGQFLVGATHLSQFVGGYHLSAQSWDGQMSDCGIFHAVSGTNTSQVLANTDCARDTRWADRVLIYLHAGETMTVAMTSSDFDTKVEVENGSGLVASDDNGGGGTNARLVYTAPASDMYFVYLTSGHDNSGGAYNLTIDVSAPAGSSPMLSGTRTTSRTATRSRTVSRTALPAAGTTSRQMVDNFLRGVKTKAPQR
ncbi:MAG TPA: Ig-like domain-containing protein [Gemmatimonadaceae bacterium]